MSFEGGPRRLEENDSFNDIMPNPQNLPLMVGGSVSGPNGKPHIKIPNIDNACCNPEKLKLTLLGECRPHAPFITKISAPAKYMSLQPNISVDLPIPFFNRSIHFSTGELTDKLESMASQFLQPFIEKTTVTLPGGNFTVETFVNMMVDSSKKLFY